MLRAGWPELDLKDVFADGGLTRYVGEAIYGPQT